MHSVSISGYGMTSDSQPGGGFQLSGARFSDSMKQSIQQAAISPDDIHLIYTHGTGLPCQDQRELRSLAGVVNCAVPLGCVLPSTGLAESASSGFAMVAALLSLRHDEAYPIPGHDASICDWNFIHTQPISVSPRNVLVTASAESGNNSALVLSKSN